MKHYIEEKGNEEMKILLKNKGPYYDITDKTIYIIQYRR